MVSRRSLCRAPALSVCWVPALSASARPALSVSGPGAGALCPGLCRRQRSLCRGAALFGALGRGSTLPASGPRALSLFASFPALSRSLCRDLCRRSLRRPALSVSGPPFLWRSFAALGPVALCIGAVPALSVSGPGLSVSGPSSLCVAVGGTLCVHPSSGPRTRAPSSTTLRPCPQLRSACHPSAPAAPSSEPRATHPALRVPFFQERSPNLTVWGKKQRSGIARPKKLSCGYTRDRVKCLQLGHAPPVAIDSQ